MKLSEQWLRQWVNPPLDSAALVEQLTAAGLEVGATHAPAAFSGVVAAEVVAVAAHRQADKLRVCRVNDGGGETAQVVCGAANVRRGMKTPFARVGATLPGGVNIQKATLRGVESAGMLCSEQELGLADKSDGLMELPRDCELGASMAEYLGLADRVIELDLTPNRGDALSVLGVAREVAAINDMAFADKPPPDPAVAIQDTLPIQLSAVDDCPAYFGRVVKGIDPAAVTPLWLRQRLRRSGLRPISPVVDITNYVMLERGQPLHAFDCNRLHGGIEVRRARPGESLTLLDGKAVELQDDVLVIADHQSAVAIAGIMGGLDSAVTEDTRDIFFESAWFNPLALAGKARRYGLHTDASHRFERGVDPRGQERALQRATALLLEICGGEAGPICRGLDESRLPARTEITLRRERIIRALGIDPAAQVAAFLARLGIACRAAGKDSKGEDNLWRVTPPPHRFDIQLEADLIEEIARLYGYDNIPETLPRAPQSMVAKPEYEMSVEGVKDLLAGRGWQEAVTYSFVDARAQALLAPERAALDLRNPLSAEMSQMRVSQWPGLIAALARNQHHRQKDVRLFEVGLNFIAREGAGGQAGPEGHDDLERGIEQRPWLSGVAAGDCRPRQWGEAARALDFFDVKGDLQALFAALRASDAFEFRPARYAALHPGQAARIYRAGEAVGRLGVLHPRLTEAFSLDGPVVLFELQLAAITRAAPRRFREISRFPGIRRDLAVIVDEAVTAEAVLAAVAAVADPTIQECRIFDVYRGAGVEKGRKSVALGLILLHNSRTLDERDVEKTMRGVLRALADQVNADLRD